MDLTAIKNHKNIMDDYFEKLDAKYPNRHKQIHKVCCKNCPSACGHDPETQDIKDYCSKDVIAKETAFVCYARESKLCKGYCDLMDIDQQYLDKLYSS